MPKDSKPIPTILLIAAMIALSAGAVGSLALTLYTGRRNASLLLPLLFGLWVVFPYAALAAAVARSRLWSEPARMTLYAMILVVTLGALATYGAFALGPNRMTARVKTAFPFLIVPPASLLITALAVTAVSRGRHS